jgi:hypothetical protein
MGQEEAGWSCWHLGRGQAVVVAHQPGRVGGEVRVAAHTRDGRLRGRCAAAAAAAAAVGGSHVGCCLPRGAAWLCFRSRCRPGQPGCTTPVAAGRSSCLLLRCAVLEVWCGPRLSLVRALGLLWGRGWASVCGREANGQGRGGRQAVSGWSKGQPCRGMRRGATQCAAGATKTGGASSGGGGGHTAVAGQLAAHRLGSRPAVCFS